MPKTSEPQWVKSDGGLRKNRDPFSVAVDKTGYRSWCVMWCSAGMGTEWNFYCGGLETAAIAKNHADKLLARLTAAIAVKETQCT